LPVVLPEIKEKKTENEILCKVRKQSLVRPSRSEGGVDIAESPSCFPNRKMTNAQSAKRVFLKTRWPVDAAKHKGAVKRANKFATFRQVLTGSLSAPSNGSAPCQGAKTCSRRCEMIARLKQNKNPKSKKKQRRLQKRRNRNVVLIGYQANAQQHAIFQEDI
jgi:hypothetical protein